MAKTKLKKEETDKHESVSPAKAGKRSKSCGLVDNRGFFETRVTLLQRVNAGDKRAFEELYNLYCPILLRYLGRSEGSSSAGTQWDVVQTFFTRFYKRFAMVEDPETGEKRIPADLLAVLNPVNKNTGKSVRIKFRQYLLTALKNAWIDEYKKATKNGKLETVSLDAPVGEDGDAKRRGDILPEASIDPRAFEREKADEERHQAMVGIFDLVVKAMANDDSLQDTARGVFKDLMKGKSASATAKEWGITENNVYVIKNRMLNKVKVAARAVFEFVKGEEGDCQGAINLLWQQIADKKIKHYDKFMVKLAKEMIAQRKGNGGKKN